jgi:hypothetical protein
MKTVTLSVANRQTVKPRALDAFSGKRRGAYISFASADLLWKEQLRRWLDNPDYAPVFEVRHRHNANWSWW